MTSSTLRIGRHDDARLNGIGLYRDVWIAAIASSRTRLATLTGAMCKTSQCELRSLRAKSGMLNVIRIVTYYTLPPLESPTSSWIAMASSRSRPNCWRIRREGIPTIRATTTKQRITDTKETSPSTHRKTQSTNLRLNNMK